MEILGGQDRESQLQAFEEIIRISFKEKRLLRLILGNRSRHKVQVVSAYTQSDDGSRIDFLVNKAGLFIMGDALLALFVTEIIMPQVPVDHDTLNRKISNKSLAVVFDRLDIGKYIKGSDKSKLNKHTKGDLIEGLLAAIYLDQGIDRARDFFRDELMS